MVLVQSMADQMEPVNAEERLDYISDTAVGSGAVKREFAQSHQRMLVRHTRPEVRTASRAELEAMGIKVSG